MYINFCNTFIFHITQNLQSSLVRVSDLFPVDTDNDTVSNLDFGRLILYVFTTSANSMGMGVGGIFGD